MSDLRMLGLYLLMALVAWLIFGGSTWFRRALGARNPDEEPAPLQQVEDRFVDVISRAGSGLPADTMYERQIFRSTIGVRLTGLFLSSVLLFLLGQSVFADLARGNIGNGVYWLLFPVAIWVYYNFYIFTYEVTLFKGQLINSGLFLNKQRYDLRKLAKVELDASGFYRLQFTGGQVARVLRYVQGHETLYKTLKHAMDQEPLTPCPSYPR